MTEKEVIAIPFTEKEVRDAAQALPSTSTAYARLRLLLADIQNPSTENPSAMTRWIRLGEKVSLK